jgi:hypothetical protein
MSGKVNHKNPKKAAAVGVATRGRAATADDAGAKATRGVKRARMEEEGKKKKKPAGKDQAEEDEGDSAAEGSEVDDEDDEDDEVFVSPPPSGKTAQLSAKDVEAILGYVRQSSQLLEERERDRDNAATRPARLSIGVPAARLLSADVAQRLIANRGAWAEVLWMCLARHGSMALGDIEARLLETARNPPTVAQLRKALETTQEIIGNGAHMYKTEIDNIIRFVRSKLSGMLAQYPAEEVLITQAVALFTRSMLELADEQLETAAARGCTAQSLDVAKLADLEALWLDAQVELNDKMADHARTRAQRGAGYQKRDTDAGASYRGGDRPARADGAKPQGDTTCRKFNGDGCDNTNCKWQHRCNKCSSTGHGATACTKPKNAGSPASGGKNSTTA